MGPKDRDAYKKVQEKIDALRSERDNKIETLREHYRNEIEELTRQQEEIKKLSRQEFKKAAMLAIYEDLKNFKPDEWKSPHTAIRSYRYKFTNDSNVACLDIKVSKKNGQWTLNPYSYGTGYYNTFFQNNKYQVILDVSKDTEAMRLAQDTILMHVTKLLQKQNIKPS